MGGPKKELPTRLRELRESLHLSLGDATRKLGFQNYQTLSQIEEGKRQVKASELPLFAKAYFCTLSTLLGEKQAPDRPALLWRKAPQNHEKILIEAEILHFCNEYTNLEKLLGIEEQRDFKCPELTVNDLRTNFDIDNRADETRRVWELGGRPAFSLRSIMEQKHGIKIVYYPLGNIGSGASIVHHEYGPVAVINSEEAPWRINYDLGHELFHLITWKAFSPENLSDPVYFDDVEKKAERFASTLLLPEAETKHAIFSRRKRESLTYSDLVDIAMEFGVSTKALIYRLYNLRLIKWATADKLAKDETLMSLDKDARKYEWGDEPETHRFYFLAARCLRKGLISRGKFASLLKIDRVDIDEFLEKRGLMEEEGAKIEIMDS